MVGLHKRFGQTHALDGLDLTVPSGQVLGLLGPNGAGKPTLVRVLATLDAPGSGTAAVFGHDVRADAASVRRLVGLTGQYAAVDEWLTGRENLRLFAQLLDFPRAERRRRADELLDRFDLMDAADRPVKTYSGGMRRRLDLASSLVGSPALLVLDEPTTGLDPRSRTRLWELVEALAAGGTTVLLTTQHLEEADRLADRIAVIDHGRIIADGSTEQLKRRAGHDVVGFRLRDEAGARGAPGRRRRRCRRRAAAPPDARRRLLRPHGRGARDGPRVRGGRGVTALASAARHGGAMTVRNLRHIGRNPQLMVFATVQPIMFLLMFAYVFGGAIAAPGFEDYKQFLTRS